jgi:hypothetical protein
MEPMAQLPAFVKGEDCNAVEEFSAFLAANPEEAAHLLAELVHRQGFGAFEDIPATDRDSTRVTDLYCRRCGDWAVFYAARRFLFLITVVLVGSCQLKSFEALEDEAEMRLRELR